MDGCYRQAGPSDACFHSHGAGHKLADVRLASFPLELPYVAYGSRHAAVRDCQPVLRDIRMLRASEFAPFAFGMLPDGHTRFLCCSFEIYIEQALNGFPLYFSRHYYAALLVYPILAMLAAPLLRRAARKPVYVP